MKMAIFIVLTFIVVGVVGILALNYFQLQSPMDSVVKCDSRSAGIDVSVHYADFIDPSTLIVDLQKVSRSNSPTDVFRVLLLYAKRQKERQFDEVALAYKGAVIFKIEGSYFQSLGEQYGFENIIYTMRTFPEHLKTPAGTQAYPEETGGWIGVVDKQLEDFGDFHKQWYLTNQ